MAEDESILTRPAPAPDEVVPYGDQVDQVADVRFGHGGARERPLVLLLHGGFWRARYDRAHTGQMAAALVALGWTVASCEYRRIPGNPDAALQDVGRAIEELPARVPGHNGGVLLVGHSAGGHLALWAASASPRIAGTLALAPVADVRLAHDRNLGDGAVLAFLGAEPDGRSDIDPCRMRPPLRRVTILHGENDETVPIALSESYAAAHPATRLVRLPRTGHYALIDPRSAAWPHVVEALRALAAP